MATKQNFMKILIIDYKNNTDFGNSYYFAGFQDGIVRGGAIHHVNEKRFYFNGDTEQECLTKAYEYCDLMNTSCSKTKFKMLLDVITWQLRHHLCCR